jgi:glycine hydroxymethyltransferase
MNGFLFPGSLGELSPELAELIDLEKERQFRKLILIPSESYSPPAVREALGSVFQNLYAEGYPDEDTRWMSEQEILDYASRLGHFRRYSDPRYYKGVEYADIIESLARRRCAEAFANARVSADQIFANVQPLSGAPANNAVYTALLNPGDTLMGMNLNHGGHLSHGSSVSRSGKVYHAVHYSVDPQTEQIDYDAVEALARETHPKIIVAGYSSYPWVPDWERFRKIADAVGAYLLADISHIAGMVAAGVVPSPLGFAHVITFTTHKTLIGPRGACVLTTDSSIARKLDRAVFPGEQGGPHVHAIAAMALTFQLARSEAFRQLQQEIVLNCQTMVRRLHERGLRIAFGGTNTHLANLDCRTITGKDGTPLNGDMAARILDVAGIVANRNTIPGDKSSSNASGVRFGTPWVTQRGLGQADMVQVADLMADLLQATEPYTVLTGGAESVRAKVDMDVLEDVRLRTRAIADRAAKDGEVTRHGYPHYYYIDDRPARAEPWAAIEISGPGLQHFVNYVFSSDVESLHRGESQNTHLITPKGVVQGVLTWVDASHYRFSFPAQQFGLAATFLRDLSDGYVAFDPDPRRRVPGPMVLPESDEPPVTQAQGEPSSARKPYYVGIETAAATGQPLPRFSWEDKPEETLKFTPLHAAHRRLGARMIPFAGWEMPVWYTSVLEEHLAVRQAAGLFDVTHMGVYEADGPQAALFLDSVCANDIQALAVGETCYTHLLDPDANVFDDLLVYHIDREAYMVVVNAANDDKDWAWLNAVLHGQVMVDRERPWTQAFGLGARLRNLRDPLEGPDQRVDMALQGPKSRDILLAMVGEDEETSRAILSLKRTEVCRAEIAGIDLIVSRTGYTGERMAFELFVHPNRAEALWDLLLSAGKPFGLKPCGLGARDSLRTEAGLPLYGNEMGGILGLGVGEAGFSSYVKTHKPWFIGRQAFLERETQRKGEVARFRFTEKGVRMAHPQDPVLDARGRMIGMVTSCAIDSEGFLTGQAFVEREALAEGTPIYVFQGKPNDMGKPPAQLLLGDRVVLPTPAVILSRFPK